jgi:Chlorophyll A-B binding protein
MSDKEGKFGFTQFAENWNGRLAMLGFLIGLATEVITGQGILTQVGLM